MIDIWKNHAWTPMLLKQIPRPFNSEEFLFELKFDGIRAIIFASSKSLYIQSRNQKDITFLFPELQEIKKLVHKNIIFDGEIVLLDGGKPSFSKLQKRMHLKNFAKINSAAKYQPVCFMAFDILYENKDLTSLPLIKRKEYLNKYIDTDYFIKTKIIFSKGIKLFNEVSKLGLEGIVAKKISGKYFINKRTDEFIKIKNIKSEDFLVGGYEEKKNGILSLALGSFIDNNFVYAGKVSISSKTDIYKLIINSKKTKNYFKDFSKKINFIKPVIKIEVNYLEKTKNGLLRHPNYKELK